MLIDKAVLIELGTGLEKSKKILDHWSADKLDTKEAYQSLYKHIIKFDKHIAATYDGISGAWYFNTVLNLFSRKILTEEDIAGFSEAVRDRIFDLDFRFKNS